jgi:hypothetical protein
MRDLQNCETSTISGGFTEYYEYDEYGEVVMKFHTEGGWGFDLQSPDEGMGPRPEPGSPGLSQVIDSMYPPNCNTWVTGGVNSEKGPYYDFGFKCERNGVGKQP